MTQTDQQMTAAQAASFFGKLHRTHNGWSSGDSGCPYFTDGDIIEAIQNGELQGTKWDKEDFPTQVVPGEEAPQKEEAHIPAKEDQSRPVNTEDQDRSEEKEQQETDPVSGEQSHEKEDKPAVNEPRGQLAQITEHYSNQDIQTIKNTIAKDCDRHELGLFLKKSATLGLNPLNGEIWCFKDRKGNVLMFAGRDGYLRAAQAHPQWDGMQSAEVRDNDEFEGNEGEAYVHHKVDIRKNRGNIVGAWAKVYRKGCKPTLKIVQLADYDKGGSAWKTNKADMIVVPAQKKALKEAFGLSGLQDPQDFYTDDQGYAVPVQKNQRAAPHESRHARTLGDQSETQNQE